MDIFACLSVRHTSLAKIGSVEESTGTYTKLWQASATRGFLRSIQSSDTLTPPIYIYMEIGEELKRFYMSREAVSIA